MNVTMGERSYLGPKIEILDSAPRELYWADLVDFGDQE